MWPSSRAATSNPRCSPNSVVNSKRAPYPSLHQLPEPNCESPLDPSREAATECSPQRKLWVTRSVQNKPQRGERNELMLSRHNPPTNYVQTTLTSNIETLILMTPMTKAPHNNRKSFINKILPATPCSPRIFSRFSPNSMIPIDHGGGGVLPNFSFRESII